MAIVYLSLGSNSGDRVGYLQQAASLIGAANDINVITSSSFYETEPWRMDSKNWFVNAVIQISTSLSPQDLLDVCKRIESQLGRKRDENSDKYSDRTIDIDILFYDNLITCNDNLTIPHPLIHKRAFVLVPMLEIAQDFVHPLFKKTISDLYDALENPEQVFLYGTRS
jgi:2-amino-4-hydroxy-6-hydroxymethyldihydropteridine diphosphokinase